MLRSGADPSTRPSYFQPLVAYLAGRAEPVGRIEIPFTRRHFEAVYVAPAAPLARGWDRQVDMEVNPLFYAGPLAPDEYHRWLLDRGVELVALPDTALDPSAEAEAGLVRQGQPFLQLVWSGSHWRVWQVVDATGLVSGPARLVRLTDDTVELEAQGPGDIVVRVHWTAYWSVDGPACVQLGRDGWVHLEARGPGRLLLHPVLLGDRVRCAR